MAKNSKIRWSRSDYVRLGKAVSEFNKKVNQLQSEQDSLYLPEVQTYKEVKQDITTRSELNRYINSLKRFSREGAEDIVTLQSGEKISAWELKELKILRKSATRRINQELKEVTRQISSDQSHVIWNDLENKKLTLEGTLKNMQELETKKGASFEHEKRIIESQGRSDYEMRNAMRYRLTYYKEVLPKFQNFKNYDKFKEKIDSIKNSLDFYNFISGSEKIGSMDEWYVEGDIMNESQQEQSFNLGLEELGIL